MSVKKKILEGYTYEDIFLAIQDWRKYATKKEAEIAYGKNHIVKVRITIEEVK